jgi:hypothetical protein
LSQPSDIRLDHDGHVGLAMGGNGGVEGVRGGQGALIPIDGVTDSVLIGDFGRDLVAFDPPLVDQGGEAGYPVHGERLERCDSARSEQMLADFLRLVLSHGV